MKLVVIALFLVFAHVHSAPSSKEKIIALRDALNKIIKENEIQVKPCTYHSCKPEMFVDCTALKLDANGCELCECDRGTPAACPRHNCNAENMNCGEAGIKVDEKGCPMCECNHIVIESRAAEEPINKGACMLLPEVGPCRGKVERFYFHRGENICKKFFYGGCGGNDNNFETREKCSATCGAKSKFNVVYDDQPAPCPMHLCSAESMDCPTGKLAKNEHGCDLCECEVIVEPEPEEPVACPLHACTAEMLGCANGLATMENGCELCECQGVTEPEGPVACPYHACTAEMLGCANGLATMENGCELCECQVVEPEGPVACHYHACTAEMLGCEFGLAVDANGCALCECQGSQSNEIEALIEALQKRGIN